MGYSVVVGALCWAIKLGGLMQYYLDYNATAPVSQVVKDTIIEAMDKYWGNSFSQHNLGRETGYAIDRARNSIADVLSVSPKKIRFTSGASEGNSWILRHFRERGKVLVSAIEHPSVYSYGDLFIPVSENGQIHLESLESILENNRKDISLISVMAANNETGVIQPTAEILKLARRFELPFHCDATQVLGKIEQIPTADYLTFSSHKVGGPKGMGCVVLAAEIDPLIQGGPQERGSRAGTHNVSSILGFASAITNIHYPNIAIRELMEGELVRMGAIIIGQESPRLPNTVCAAFQQPGDLLTMALDLKGIAVSTGSACSSGAPEVSQTLKAMNVEVLPVRFSFGPELDRKGCEYVLKGVRTILEDVCEW